MNNYGKKSGQQHTANCDLEVTFFPSRDHNRIIVFYVSLLLPLLVRNIERNRIENETWRELEGKGGEKIENWRVKNEMKSHKSFLHKKGFQPGFSLQVPPEPSTSLYFLKIQINS